MQQLQLQSTEYNIVVNSGGNIAPDIMTRLEQTASNATLPFSAAIFISFIQNSQF